MEAISAGHLVNGMFSMGQVQAPVDHEKDCSSEPRSEMEDGVKYHIIHSCVQLTRCGYMFRVNILERKGRWQGTVPSHSLPCVTLVCAERDRSLDAVEVHLTRDHVERRVDLWSAILTYQPTKQGH